MARIWKTPILVLATAYFVLDGLFSYVTRPVALWMSKMRILDRTRRWIVSLRPYPSLALFAVPVIILSAKRSVDDRVRGLRMGGDDYLTKPFAIVELVARLEALLRRPAESRETTLRVGPLELDLIERTAKRGDRVIDLLPREFRLLEYMMQRSDQLLTRAMLLEEVWNYKFVPATNLVDVHMGRLRHKVDGPGETPMIHNVRGAGFILRTGS